MVEKIWDSYLTGPERGLLLHAAYPSLSARLVNVEVKLPWRDLFLATQLRLRDVDWCVVLDRDVRPD